MGQGFPNQRVGVNLGAGTGTALTGTVVLSNSNNVSFGMQTTTGGSFVVTASATAAAQTGISALSAGTTQATSGTVSFSNANGVSFGIDGNTITASVAAQTAATGISGISAGTTQATSGTVSFANSNGVSFGINGQTMTVSTGYSFVDYANQSYVQGFANITNLTALSERPFFIPFNLPYYLTWNRLVWEGSRSTSGSNSFSVTYGIYTIVNSTQMSLLGSWSNSYSGTATASLSGIRQFFGTNVATAVSALSPGMYVMAFHFHTLGGTASLNYSIRGASTDSPLGVIGPGADQNSTATSQMTSIGFQFMGRYSVTTASLPNSVADSQLWHGLSGSQLFVPAWFRLGRT